MSAAPAPVLKRLPPGTRPWPDSGSALCSVHRVRPAGERGTSVSLFNRETPSADKYNRDMKKEAGLRIPPGNGTAPAEDGRAAKSQIWYYITVPRRCIHQISGFGKIFRLGLRAVFQNLAGPPGQAAASLGSRCFIKRDKNITKQARILLHSGQKDSIIVIYSASAACRKAAQAH